MFLNEERIEFESDIEFDSLDKLLYFNQGYSDQLITDLVSFFSNADNNTITKLFIETITQK